MTWLAELLPLCFVRWYAKRHMERFSIGKLVVVQARHDTLFVIRK